jgi:hypothetical protein
MKTRIVLIRIAGSFSLLFMLFHFTFYRMLDWEHGLSCLSQDNRAIMLTYHYISFLILGFMGIIPIVQTKSLLTSPLKYTILSFFALFYLIRIITEFTLFGFSLPKSPVIIVMCAIPLTFFAIPLFYKLK